jgi:large subunit ribosomal protein L10e
MLTGAGADRMSSGMAHSFGQAIGVAAQIKANSKLFSVFCQEPGIPIARKILSDVKTKIPGKKSIIVEKVN